MNTDLLKNTAQGELHNFVATPQILITRIKQANTLLNKNRMSKENMHLFADTSVVDSVHRNKNDSLFKLSLYGREVSYKGNSYFIHSVRESGAFYSAFATRNVEVEIHSFDDQVSWGYVDINEVEFFLSDDHNNTLRYKEFKSIAPLASLIDNIFEGV